MKPLFKKGSQNGSRELPSNLFPTAYVKSAGENSILNNFQSAFRENYSNDFCLSYLTDKISKGFDSGLLVAMNLIDLQKASDTMDHNILLLKMLSLEFSREVTDWYESYLSNRKFYVNVHDKFSTSADLQCGVPEGPIRKSLLFLLYKRYAASCFYFSTQMIYVCYSNIKVWSE